LIHIRVELHVPVQKLDRLSSFHLAVRGVKSTAALGVKGVGFVRLAVALVLQRAADHFLRRK